MWSMPAADNFFAELLDAYPWLRQINVDPDWFRDLVAESTGGSEIVAKLRSSQQYRSRFVGMFRDDGSMRMSEAEYLQTEGAYRTLLRQYGHPVDDSNPTELVGFFQSDQDPNELRDRLEVYRGVEQSAQPVKDAFYVYAGLKVTTDDLYEATVDAAASQRLTQAANRAAATSALNYQGWIQRATEVGLERIADRLGELQARGAVTAEAVQNVIRINPEFAEQMVDAIYTNGGQVGATLGLQDVLEAFDFAAIGAAATNSGLELPTKERLEQIRSAGIERVKAIQGYQDYGRNAGVYSAAVQRARGRSFDQSDFESGAFLGDATDARDLQAGLAQEEAAGLSGGGFRFSESDSGRINQRGLDRY